MVKIAIDALLRCLFKLFFLNTDGREFAVSGHYSVQLLTVLLHHLLKIVVGKVHGFCLVIIGMHKAYQLVALLNNDTLADHCH